MPSFDDETRHRRLQIGVVQPFTDLKVWQHGHRLVLAIYRLTAAFPSDERFGITSQLRRAAVSVPTNIAEGSKRLTDAEFARFLNIAEGSLVETQYLLMLSRDLSFAGAEVDALLAKTTEAAKMLHGLRVRVSRGR